MQMFFINDVVIDDLKWFLVDVSGREISFTPFNIGFFVAFLSLILIFYIESSLARNVLGFLIGSGFSPAFTSHRTDSDRYFVLCFALIAFIFMMLAGFRWPLITAFFILALSSLSEFESKAMMEVIEREKEKK